ncbi:telomere-protecting terminal protein Tpg [Yinghuangia aomiensis]
MKAERGSTRAVAARLGVTQRTVERYLAGTRKSPRKPLLEALEREVRKSWQPRVRKRARRQAAATGITVELRARFGYASAAGSTDDPRLRRLTQHLPGEYAARLIEAQDTGATDRELRAIVAEGLQEVYFKDGETAPKAWKSNCSKSTSSTHRSDPCMAWGRSICGVHNPAFRQPSADGFFGELHPGRIHPRGDCLKMRPAPVARPQLTVGGQL